MSSRQIAAPQPGAVAVEGGVRCAWWGPGLHQTARHFLAKERTEIWKEERGGGGRETEIDR